MRPVSLRLAFLAAVALLAPGICVRSDGQTTPKAATPPAKAKAKMDAKAKGAEPAGPREPTRKTAEGPTPLVNLNTANVDELQALPGIGPAYAKAIVAGRPYQSVDDLAKVKGLGKAKIDALRDRVTTTMPATTAPARPTTPKAAPTPKSVATPKAPGVPLNINTASKDELDVLPGIGPVKAQAIIERRPFAKVEDIMKVPGIKQVEFSRIKDLISVK